MSEYDNLREEIKQERIDRRAAEDKAKDRMAELKAQFDALFDRVGELQCALTREMDKNLALAVRVIRADARIEALETAQGAGEEGRVPAGQRSDRAPSAGSDGTVATAAPAPSPAPSAEERAELVNRLGNALWKGTGWGAVADIVFAREATLRAELDEYQARACEDLAEAWRERDALRAQLAAAEADVARLDRLSVLVRGGDVVLHRMPDCVTLLLPFRELCVGGTLRAAIDAAKEKR